MGLDTEWPEVFDAMLDLIDERHDETRRRTLMEAARARFSNSR
jgi:hypothetical protein